MKITRRKFIAARTVVAGAILSADGVMGQKGVRTGGLPPAQLDPASVLSWDSFLPYQGTDFVFQTDAGERITAVLKEMNDSSISNSSGPASGECFTLKFVGPGKPIYSQDTYDVTHFALGNFKVFVTDGGRARRGNYYIAVFNRIAG